MVIWMLLGIFTTQFSIQILFLKTVVIGVIIISNIVRWSFESFGDLEKFDYFESLENLSVVDLNALIENAYYVLRLRLVQLMA